MDFSIRLRGPADVQPAAEVPRDAAAPAQGNTSVPQQSEAGHGDR